MDRNSDEKGIPRPVEVAACLAGSVVVLPLVLLAAILIKSTSDGPALFRQERVGRGGRIFSLLKLRTMTANSRGPQVTATGDPRITLLGRLLRKMKIDELPALWNVIRGDLSLVGARPEVPKYVDIEDPLWRTVLGSRPGITDPVTIRLRNEEELLAGFEDPEPFYLTKLQRYKLLGYARYLRNRTWRSDMLVLAKTMFAIALPEKAPPPTVKEVEAVAALLDAGDGLLKFQPVIKSHIPSGT